MKFLLVQGANMEALGRRQPELYGTTTARQLDGLLRRQARRQATRIRMSALRDAAEL